MLLAAAILIILPIVNSTLASDEITSTDWVYRHTVWIDYYLKGDFSPALQYPPLFHFLMLPFVAAGFAIKYMQIVFCVLNLVAVYYFLKHAESESTLLITFMLLATSVTFVGYSSALMPQALDYVLFPMMILLYLKGKDNAAVLVGAAIFAMHLSGLLFMGIIFLHALITKNRAWKKYLIAALILVPIFFYYETVAVSLQHDMIEFTWDAVAQAEWESQFLEPLKFIIYSGFMLYVLFPFAVYGAIKKKFKFTKTQLLYIIWIAVFLLMAFSHFGVWRMVSYLILPFSLLTASLVSPLLKSEENEIS